MVLSRDLIERGYFPVELPPPFNTSSLANNLSNLPINTQRKTNSKCCRYSIPKIGKARRLLGIPNPLHQIILCNQIERNWTEIERFVNQSTLSLTTPVVRPSPDRALSRRHDLSIISERRITEAPCSRFLLRTDISNYFPTIYTHSIAWALHTKTIAKMERNNRSLLGNALDTALRNTQEQQTGGIPIGPDTSLVIGEIIGTAIDQLLCSCINNIAGFRYVDDYYLYFNTMSQAESALSKLHEVLREFELNINPEKTSILSLPQPMQPPWLPELSRFEIRDFAVGQKLDLINYFSKAFEFAIAYPDDSVLKYALGRFRREKIHAECWPLFEALLLKCIVAEPGVLPFATRIFVSYSRQGNYQLNSEKITQALFTVIDYYGKLNYGFEVAWALWLCKTLGLNITNPIAKQILRSEDSIVGLIALDMRNNGLLPRVKVSPWYFAIRDADELYDEHWLLAYEAKIKGWMRPRNIANHVANDPFFSVLAQRGVSFYDASRQVEEIDLFTNRNISDDEHELDDEEDDEYDPDEDLSGYY